MKSINLAALLLLGALVRLSAQIEVISNGNVGVGTASPSGTLHVVTPVNSDTNQPRFLSGSSTASAWNEILLGAGIANYKAAMFRYFNGEGTASTALLSITHYGDTTGLSLRGGGNVGIGTTNPSYKLEVAGTVRATSFISNTTTYADFVFKPGYQLASLAEVEQHINQHGTLPGVPSEAQVAKEGIDLAAMQVKLLQKIEELTLHAIAQQKEITALRDELATLRIR